MPLSISRSEYENQRELEKMETELSGPKKPYVYGVVGPTRLIYDPAIGGVREVTDPKSPELEAEEMAEIERLEKLVALREVKVEALRSQISQIS